MNYNKKYTLGLDVGEFSCGWALMEVDNDKNPKRIIDVGSYLWNAIECYDNMQTKKTKASNKRQLNGNTRRLRRKKQRIIKGINLLKEYKFLQDNFDIKKRTINDVLISVQNDDPTINRKEYFNNEGKFAGMHSIRVRAIYEKIPKIELAYILYYFLNHRGYKNKYMELDEDRKYKYEKYINKVSKGKDGVNNGLLKTLEVFKDGNYKTIGEAILKADHFYKNDEHTPRNKAGVYVRSIVRFLIEDEIEKILDKQKEYYKDIDIDEFKKKYFEILNEQKPFDDSSHYDIKKMIGKCTFEDDELRASKMNFYSELKIAFENLTNLKYKDKNNEYKYLSYDEKQIIINKILDKGKVNYFDIRKILGYENYEDKIYQAHVYSSEKDDDWLKIEKNQKIEMPFYYECKKKLAKLLDVENIIFEQIVTAKEEPKFIKLINILANIFSTSFTEESLLNRLEYSIDEFGEICDKFVDKDGLNDELMGIILELFEKRKKGFNKLSVKALKNILPHYISQEKEHIDNYMAQKRTGYKTKSIINMEKPKYKYITKKCLKAQLDNISNPIVIDVLKNVYRLVNEIIKEYGIPYYINLEVAREIAMSQDKAKKITMGQNKRKNEKKNNKKELNEKFDMEPNGKNIEKYELYKEQGEGRCPYCGASISIQNLFEEGFYEVDHVVPRSQGGTNKGINKVLVCAKCNQGKGNRTPYQYFSELGKWDEYCVRINDIYKGGGDKYRKRSYLLQENFEGSSNWKKDVDLKNTQYACLEVCKLLSNLELGYYEKDKEKVAIRIVNGATTAIMRDNWISYYETDDEILNQIDIRDIRKKDRTKTWHHAIDAVIIACISPGIIKKVADCEKRIESIYLQNQKKEIRRVEIQKEQPYVGFVQELRLRIKDTQLSDVEKKWLQSTGMEYPYTKEEVEKLIHPFITYKKEVKFQKGCLHKDTIRRKIKKNNKMIYLERLDLTKLISEDMKIEKLEKLLCENRTKLKNYISGDERVERPVVAAIKKLIEIEDSVLTKDKKQKEKNNIIENVYKESAKGKGNKIKSVYLEDTKVSLEKVLEVRGGYAISDTILYQQVVKKDGKYYFVPYYINGKHGETPDDVENLFKVYKNTLLKVKHKDGMEFLCTYLTNSNGNKVKFLPLNENRDGDRNIKVITTTAYEFTKVKLSRLGRVIEDNGLS